MMPRSVVAAPAAPAAQRAAPVSFAPPTLVMAFFMGSAAAGAGLTLVGVDRATAGFIVVIAIVAVFLIWTVARPELARPMLFMALPLDPLIRLWGNLRHMTLFYGMLALMLTNSKELTRILRAPDRFTVLLLALVGWMLVTLSWSSAPWTGFQITCSVLFLAIAWHGPRCVMPNLAAFYQCMSAMVIGGLMMFAILLVLLSESWHGRLGSVEGMLAGADVCYHLAVPAVAALYLYLSAPRKSKPWFLAAFVAMTTATVMTLSRGGILGMMVAILMLAFFGGIKRTGSRFSRIATTLVFILIAFSVANTFVGEDIESRTAQTLDAGSNMDHSLGGRLGIWSTAWTMIRENPILGIGTGAFPQEFMSYSIRFDVGEHFRYRQSSSHNIPLRMAAESGIIAGLVYLTLLGIAVAHAWRMRRELGHTGAFALGLTLFSITISQFTTAIVYTPWMSIGIVGFIRAQVQRRSAIAAGTPAQAKAAPLRQALRPPVSYPVK